MSTLAILGGTPLRTQPFPRHPVVGDEEKRAVMDVLDRGELSTFIAAPGRYFNGGTNIREFERIFAEYHGSKHAVAFNSATAALHAAVVAVGVQPGDEVITTSYSFTSSATCALMHNAIPVFADVEEDIFCLDPVSVEQRIGPLTRAVIPVHLFGHPANMDGFMALARRRGLKVIEDCAQAPGARFRGKPAGTIADCGIFSFTENKNITTGEGGMLITNDDAIAEGARMVRNHGEMVVEGQTVRTYNPSMLGWNYRLTEMEAALGIVQFGRMDALNGARIELADYLTSKLSGVNGLRPPVVRPESTHVYYIYAMKYDAEVTGIPRDVFVKALQAEGIPFAAGYVKPLYLTPIYHEHRPFAFRHYTGSATYDKGLCPVTERLYERELIQTQIARPPATRDDMDDVVRAIHKVLDARRQLATAGAIGG
jgi:dTDP-4-amino-4,6-dideoxygalactose transaminase